MASRTGTLRIEELQKGTAIDGGAFIKGPPFGVPDHETGAGVAIGLLVAAISFFEERSAAFALRLGPFHLGLPFFGHSLDTRIESCCTRTTTPVSPTMRPRIQMPSARNPRKPQPDQRLPSSIPASPCRPFMTTSFGLRRRGPLAMTRFCKLRLPRRLATGIGACVKPIVDPRLSSTLPE